MKTLTTAVTLGAFCAVAFACDAVVRSLHLRFSSAVIALIAVLAVLVLRRSVDAPVARAARELQRWFPLFFVPACAGVIADGTLLRGHVAAVAGVLAVSTLLGAVAGAAAGVVAARAART